MTPAPRKCLTSRQRLSSKSIWGCIAVCAVVLTAASPARADFCYQLEGGTFSGDLGFVRFQGAKPTLTGSMQAVAGRIAGLGPVFGTAIITKDGTTFEIGATFFVDAVQGQFDIAFNPPSAKTGSGYGDFGAYNINDSITATKVACSSEP